MILLTAVPSAQAPKWRASHRCYGHHRSRFHSAPVPKIAVVRLLMALLLLPTSMCHPFANVELRLWASGTAIGLITLTGSDTLGTQHCAACWSRTAAKTSTGQCAAYMHPWGSHRLPRTKMLPPVRAQPVDKTLLPANLQWLKLPAVPALPRLSFRRIILVL